MRGLSVPELILLIAIFSLTTESLADTFGNGINRFDIDFVIIGNPDNVADTTGLPNHAGGIDYAYRISKFEISEDMIDKANVIGGLPITHDNRGNNKPATSISWFEAAKFVNLLNTSTGHAPAYKFDQSGSFQMWQPSDVGYNPNNVYRNRQALYVLPSLDEWYKAAYYDPTRGDYYDYPTGSDSAPDGNDFRNDPSFDAVFFDGAFAQPNDIYNVGVFSPYGTKGQGGNVWEWIETDNDLVNDSTSSFRGNRGGYWGSSSEGLRSTWSAYNVPSSEFNFLGFRIASQPPLPFGDYNRDSVIDAADYVVWRKGVGNVVTPCSGADANCNGFVELAEYQPWRSNFGTDYQSTGEAARGGAAVSVPEPISTTLALAGAMVLACARCRVRGLARRIG